MPLVLRVTLTHALMITGFVFVMMLVIEYLNVLTRGMWQQGLRGSRGGQYLLAALLGAVPGCMGAFAVVALYSHRVVSFGAVVAAMIATSGDESFVMLSMVLGTAGIIFLLLFVVGVVAGLLSDLLLGEKAVRWAREGHEIELREEACECFPWGRILQQWKNCTPARGILSLALAQFIFGLLLGQVGPPSWNGVKVSLLLTSALGLFIVGTVPDHFLEEHLWEHTAKTHVPRVFLWTFGALWSCTCWWSSFTWPAGCGKTP